MTEAALNALANQYLDLTLCKSRYDDLDIQWYTEGPFWRRTSMRFSRDYKILPDYEIADAKHGKTLKDILDESEYLLKSLNRYKETADQEEMGGIKPGSPGKRLRTGENPGISEADFHPKRSAS